MKKVAILIITLQLHKYTEKERRVEVRENKGKLNKQQFIHLAYLPKGKNWGDLMLEQNEIHFFNKLSITKNLETQVTPTKCGLLG